VIVEYGVIEGTDDEHGNEDVFHTVLLLDVLIPHTKYNFLCLVGSWIFAVLKVLQKDVGERTS
jgi:hypothetical protein